MEIKYLEWNINARGNNSYKLPHLVADYLCSNNVDADIIVLTEFRIGDEWLNFKNQLGKNYVLFTSAFNFNGYNQVCIALKKDIFMVESVICQDICDRNIPEILHIRCKVNNKLLNIVGTRIKTQSDTKLKQYNFLNTYLKKLDNVLCVGDFNCVSSVLQNKLDSSLIVSGPRIVNGYHSYVFSNGDKQALDWVITKKIKSENPYEDKANSPYATYDWNFLSYDKIYNEKNENSYLNINGFPDHAILKGSFDI